MAELEKYKAKRNFKKTAEPAGGKPCTDKLLFVVKHAAHLHDWSLSSPSCLGIQLITRME